MYVCILSSALGVEHRRGIAPGDRWRRAANSAVARWNTWTLDDESEPAKGSDNANKLVTRDKVDILVGTVHSGVVAAMVKVARDTDTMLVIPNGGVGAATGPLCASNIFRTSFSNWQPAYAMGKVAAEQGRKRAVAISWDYAAGKEFDRCFHAGFRSNT